MPKDSTETKNSRHAGTKAATDAHQRAALAALLHELEEVDELREAVKHARDAREARLALIEELIEQIDVRIAEEVEATERFDAAYECGCGCADEKDGTASKLPEPAADATPATQRRPRARGRSNAQVVFGALSVGCAVAALAASWLRGRDDEHEAAPLAVHEHEVERARPQTTAREAAADSATWDDEEPTHA